MCLDCMYIRATHAALKQENSHNCKNMQQIIAFFQGQLKFKKRHLLDILPKQLNVLCFLLL